MSEKPPSLLYVVRWTHGDRPMDRRRKPAQVQGLFASRDKAEQLRQRLEDKARRAGFWQPVWQSLLTSGFARLSEFEYPILLDWLEDHGVPAPPRDIQVRYYMQDPLGEWLTNLTTEQAVALYEGLHHFHFYEIVEVPLIDGDYPEALWDDWEAQPGQRWVETQGPTQGHPDQRQGSVDDDIPF